MLRLATITPELKSRLEVANAADGGHHAPLASHVFLTESGEIIGSAGLCVPAFTFWAKTDCQKRHAAEMAWRAIAECRAKSAEFLSLCSDASPYHPLMGHLGFKRIGNADVFVSC